MRIQSFDLGIPQKFSSINDIIVNIGHNKFPPVFQPSSYLINMMDDLQAGKKVLTVQATDSDSAVNFIVFYNIEIRDAFKLLWSIYYYFRVMFIFCVYFLGSVQHHNLQCDWGLRCAIVFQCSTFHGRRHSEFFIVVWNWYKIYGEHFYRPTPNYLHSYAPDERTIWVRNQRILRGVLASGRVFIISNAGTQNDHQNKKCSIVIYLINDHQ